MSINLTSILQRIQGINVFFAGPNAGRQNGVVLEDSDTVSWSTDGYGNIQATSAGGDAPTGAANEVFATPNGSAGAATIRALVTADLPAGVALLASNNTFTNNQIISADNPILQLNDTAWFNSLMNIGMTGEGTGYISSSNIDYGVTMTASAFEFGNGALNDRTAALYAAATTLTGALTAAQLVIPDAPLGAPHVFQTVNFGVGLYGDFGRQSLWFGGAAQSIGLYLSGWTPSICWNGDQQYDNETSGIPSFTQFSTGNGIWGLGALGVGQGAGNQGTLALGFICLGPGTQLTAAATIAPTNSIHHVTGATVIETITVPSSVSAGWRFTLIADDASGQAWGATGNIAKAGVFVQHQAQDFIYDGTSFFPLA